MHNRFDRFLEHLIPQHCLVCGQIDAGSPICAACAVAMPYQPAECCPVCALPSAHANVCGACLRKPPPFDATHALYLYRFPVDRLVQALKYRGRLALAAHFGAMLAEFPLSSVPDLILPMPLHPARLRHRGFNQAVEIARPLARRYGRSPEGLVVDRVVDTAAQADLPLSDRRANMRGAFACRVRLDGRHVVVVDDVMTTGASLEALATCLKRYGAARVENLVVARTPAPA